MVTSASAPGLSVPRSIPRTRAGLIVNFSMSRGQVRWPGSISACSGRLSAGGDVGSGGNTRIRGASSMTLSSEPLIYIDGVRVNNAAADAGGFPGVGVDSRYPPSRINDISPDEIESIEIAKGPAAATLYGTEASNGVINILTKRGSRGQPTVTYQVNTGANWVDRIVVRDGLLITSRSPADLPAFMRTIVRALRERRGGDGPSPERQVALAG